MLGRTIIRITVIVHDRLNVTNKHQWIKSARKGNVSGIFYTSKGRETKHATAGSGHGDLTSHRLMYYKQKKTTFDVYELFSISSFNCCLKDGDSGFIFALRVHVSRLRF